MDGFSRSDLPYWLALQRIPSVGPRTVVQLIDAFGSVAALFQAGRDILAATGLSEQLISSILNPDWKSVDKQISAIDACGAEFITLADPGYPRALKAIHDPPPVLFSRGQASIIDSLQLSIVGSRRPSPDGKRIARDLACRLSGLGVVITSGMATGIDTSAHLGALDNGSPTIAVLGSGMNRIYPPGNQGLAEKITEHGVLLTEFLPDTPPSAPNFPRRNRIISGLSLGTVVVEAACRSGSLITANLAVEQGREVFAVPGPIHSPLSRGCHGLIRQGAKLVEDIDDILEEIRPLSHLVGKAGQFPGADAKKIKELDESGKLLLDYIGNQPVSIDFLANNTGLAVNVITVKLLEMELKGLIETRPGGKYSRSCHTVAK